MTAEKGKRRLLALAVVVLIAAAGCSSSSKTSGSSSTPGGSSSGKGTSYTLGVLADLTGPIADTGKSTPAGVKAGIGLYNSEGYNLKYVIADTGSSPAGTLTAAQKLVDQDHVFAIITTSGLTFAAAPFLTSHGIPVLGAQVDGPEWVTSPNMFSVFGYSLFNTVQTTTGNILNLLKATNFSAIGYSISPSSSNAAKSAAASAQHGGVKVGYLNTSYPFGSTNVTPSVLAMKAAGVDSFEGLVEQVTSYAILAGMRQQGVTLKVPILSTGFGSDILQADAATQQAAQNAYFLNVYQPIMLNTPATQRFSNALQKYAGIPGEDATYNVYHPYISVDAFVTGLKAAGGHPTQAQFINAMLGITKYNAAGLYGNHTISFAMAGRGQGANGADNCTYIMLYQGNTFHQVAGGEPICGATIPGKKV
jgi:branched-chain amino acid transport system substrate-binding protein